MREKFLDGRVELLCGDCLDVLASLEENSIDSVVTDPPYHLTSIVKRFGAHGAKPTKSGKSGVYARSSKGFMQKTWDGGDIAFRPETWAAVMRVLKPGGHLVAFGATKNSHRLTCAIEDAGFEIRDSLMYMFGTGFPKSHDISKRIDRCECQDGGRYIGAPLRQYDLRSMSEANLSESEHGVVEREKVLQHGVPKQGLQSNRSSEGESIHDGEGKPGMEGRRDISKTSRKLRSSKIRSLPAGLDRDGAQGRLRDGAPLGNGAQDRSDADANGVRAPSGSRATAQRGNKPRTVAGQSLAQDGGAWENCGRCGKPLVPEGLGTALKPAFEPITLARKPLSEGTVAANVLRWRTGALNIDASRVAAPDGVPKFNKRNEAAVSETLGNGLNGSNRTGEMDTATGRWPANVVHDGSDEVVGAFPAEAGAFAPVRGTEPSNSTVNVYGARDRTATLHHGDSGSAARFYYSAKADADDRIGSKHPTVKPVDLMQWLVRMVTPPGGTVIDPFAGTGTTGEAAWLEGFNAVLIEREPEYQADIRRRMKLCLAGPDEKARESIKAKLAGKPEDHGPLFGGLQG